MHSAGCGDNDLPEANDDAHTAAMFEPTTDAIIVAAWAASARAATAQVTAGGEHVTSVAIALSDDGGHGAVDVTGLEPDTSYSITVVFDDGARSGPFAVRTAPPDAETRPVRIAFSADLDPSSEFDSALLEHVADYEPELFVTIGDFPYTDNGPPAMDVATYRERHVELRAAPKVHAWLKLHGLRSIYDDHEFRNNWDAQFVATEADRYAAAVQVWDEFFPLRDAPPGIRYRSWRWGAHVEAFLLDTRRFRSADAAPDDANKTMLGATQLQWFLAAIAQSTATFKLVFTTIPLDFTTDNDAWSSFTTERQVIFDALATARVPGVLFLSGDQHFFAAHRHQYGIREFQAGPLARGLGTPAPPAAGVLYRNVQYNFAVLDIGPDAISVAGVGADGTVFYKETLTVADLTPVRPAENQPSGG